VSDESSTAGDADAPDEEGAPGDAGGDADAPDQGDAPEGWRDRLDAAGELTPEIVAAILEAHDDRGTSAIEAVGEGRVKGYEDFTVVVGHSDEYVIEEGACTCKDATYNLDPEDPAALCWHALAVEIARRVDAVDHHDMFYSEVRDFL